MSPAEQAMLARGDPADLQQLATRRAARLTVTLAAALARLNRRVRSARKHARVAIPVALAWVGIALALQAAGRHRNRAAQRPPEATRKRSRPQGRS